MNRDPETPRFDELDRKIRPRSLYAREAAYDAKHRDLTGKISYLSDGAKAYKVKICKEKTRFTAARRVVRLDTQNQDDPRYPWFPLYSYGGRWCADVREGGELFLGTTEDLEEVDEVIAIDDSTKDMNDEGKTPW